MRSYKNILMITQAPFPPDIRLEKEIKSLSGAGYKVLVVCNQYDKALNPSFDYCEIRRINAIFKSIKSNRIINFPIFFNPRYISQVFISINNFKLSFIHAHDLPMVPIALLFGKLFRLPVIFDMHENYPEALRAFKKKGVINYIFKNYRAAKFLEKICLKWVDIIITVVQENMNRLIAEGVDKKKIFVVSNTVDLETFGKDPVLKEIKEKYKEKIVLLYTGYVTPERGLDTAVKGLSFAKDNIKNIVLIIIGNGIEVTNLKKLADKFLISNYVEFIEWPGHDKLSTFYNIADICISPQPQCEFWDTTIPHKLFEYMSQSTPVLAANSKVIKRIISETNSGMIYKSGDPKDFADKVQKMLSSDIPFGENGLKAVNEKYNWEKDAQVLIKLYQDFESN